MVPEPVTGIEELAFDSRDAAVFTIPDVRTKVTTVQNYFFPRLEILLRHTLQVVRQVYGVDPYERMTFAYRPSNRRASRTLVTYDFDEAYIGVCGKRRYDRDLAITRSNGKPFRLYPTYLTFTVLPEGSLYVELLPFRQDVDATFVDRVAEMFAYHLDRLEPLLLANHISHSSAHYLVSLADAFRPQVADFYGIWLHSPKHYFPVRAGRGLERLIAAFVALYPLVEAIMSLAEGKRHGLSRMLDAVWEWYLNPPEEVSQGSCTDSAPEADPTAIELPELDSYRFIRAGLWWSVLARDQWTCCSCGRSAREHGVTLEVDHILPRSLGGTDDLSNLQTLCRKCNSGKGNRDTTDLRRGIDAGPE